VGRPGIWASKTQKDARSAYPYKKEREKKSTLRTFMFATETVLIQNVVEGVSTFQEQLRVSNIVIEASKRARN